MLTEDKQLCGDEIFAAGSDAIRRRVEQAPECPQVREDLVKLLIREDRISEALPEIEALERLAPGRDDWLVLRGQLGMRRQDWDGAYAAWKTHLDRNPSDWNSANAIERLKRVRQLAHASDTHDQTRPTPIAPGVCQDEDVRQLMLNFESIGSDCEFGTVQRRFGAEPLGLLRWSETTLDTLMAALAAKFDGLGNPAYTGLHVSPSLHREIYLYDTRWYLLMNTFLYEGEVALTALMPKLCRYVAYLRDRFLEDLAVGRKTVVFKSDTITKRELLTLHDMFLAFGPVRLLNVRLASSSPDFPAGEAGSVSEIRTGLYVGRLQQFIMRLDADYNDWIAICRTVERLGATSSATESIAAATP